MICLICNYNNKNSLGFTTHLKFKHKIKPKEYFDTYLKKKDEGTCIIHKYSPYHIVVEFNGHLLKGRYHLINAGVFGRRRDYKKKVYQFFKAKDQKEKII